MFAWQSVAFMPSPYHAQSLYVRFMLHYKTMFSSNPNKLLQERNSYLISFPRYSGGSVKIGLYVYIYMNVNYRFLVQ